MIGVGLLDCDRIGPVNIDYISYNNTTMSRFLNRILGLPVQLQNQVFSFFSDTLAAMVLQARRSGSWEGGICDFGSNGEQVEIVHTDKYISDAEHNTAATLLHTVSDKE